LPISVLAVPTRRAILERLRRGPLTVGEIAAGLPVTRPAISQHLKKLKTAGLVRSRRRGTSQIYAMDPVGLAELRAYLESFWTAALAGFAAAAAKTAAIGAIKSRKHTVNKGTAHRRKPPRRKRT
jgi:DNA-binding transcriptional ArsR family regulator